MGSLSWSKVSPVFAPAHCVSKRSECKLLVQHVVGPSPLQAPQSHHQSHSSPPPPPSPPPTVNYYNWLHSALYLGESQVQVFHSIIDFITKEGLVCREYGTAVSLLHVYYWDDRPHSKHSLLLKLLSSLPVLSFSQFDCIWREKMFNFCPLWRGSSLIIWRYPVFWTFCASRLNSSFVFFMVMSSKLTDIKIYYWAELHEYFWFYQFCV